MRNLEEWPNKLGLNLGETEIWKHAKGFRVFTPEKVLWVPYTATNSPEMAAQMCEAQGLSREELDSMDYQDAQELFERGLTSRSSQRQKTTRQSGS